MLHSMSFTFNGKSCEDMGCVMVTTSSGLYKDHFLPTRKIRETSINGRSKPYFQGVDSEPLSFSLSVYIKDWKDRNSLREIASWLYTDYYKPLWFESNPHHIYYAIVEGSSELLHNGANEGYFDITFRTNSPYSYSPIKNENNPITVNGTQTRLFYNEGDLPIVPRMIITKTVSDGDIKITNNDTGEVFELRNIHNGEIVEVDCVNENLISSLEFTGRYLFDNHNDNWLKWYPDKHGRSTSFTFEGDFIVDFTFQYTYLNESNPLLP